MKTVNHRWLSVFFLAASAMAFFLIGPDKSLLLKYGVVGISALVGLWFLFNKSENKIWIYNGKLHFSQARGKQLKSGSVPIQDIKSFRIVFSGHHGGNSIVRHSCYVITHNGEKTKLPDGIKYAAYNPNHVGLPFLIRPLQDFNRNIAVEVDDEKVTSKAKPVFK